MAAVTIKGGSNITIGNVKTEGSTDNTVHSKCRACGHEERVVITGRSTISLMGKCPKCGSFDTETNVS